MAAIVLVTPPTPTFLVQPYPLLSILCSRTAARSTLASWPWSAASCSPRGKPLATGIGIDIAGVPKAVHGAFILGSPVDARPNDAGPTAAGVRITGVALNSSANRGLHESTYRTVSLYRSAEICRPFST